MSDSDEQERQAVLGAFHRMLYPEQYEADALRAGLAKAQARVAELERSVRYFVEMSGCKNGCTIDDMSCETSRAKAALASDGTKALAAVRLAQRALKDSINMLEPDDWREGGRADEYRAAESALTQAFGEGE